MKKKLLRNNLSFNLCAILLISSTLYAQQNTKLDEITVTSKGDSSYQSNKRIKLNRTGIDTNDSSKSIQIFNEDFIRDAQFQNIEDIIKMSSNTIYTGDNHGRSNSISMRGFSNVPLLFNGLKITNKIAHPEVFNLESIEMQKGPDSLQYGQSSPGGLVNLVAKKPTKDPLAILEFGLSDNPSYNAKIDLGGSLNKEQSLYFRLVSALTNDEGWTNSNTDVNRIFIAPSISYDFNDNHTISLIAEYTDETTPSSFGTYVDDTGKLVTDISNVMSNPDEELKKVQKIIGLDFDSTFNSWNSNFKYRYIDYVADNGDVHISTLGYDKLTDTVNRFYAKQKQSFQEHVLQYTLNKEVNIFSLRNRLTVGVDYNKSYSQLSFFTQRPPFYSLDLSNLVYEDLTRLSDHSGAINMSSAKKEQISYGIFLQDNINITDNLILNAGVRHSVSKPQDTQKSDATTPSIGLVYHLTPEMTLFTNYSESFNPSSKIDKNNNILDPEKGKGMEIGLKNKLFNDNVSLTTSLFKIKKENIALFDEDNSGATYFYKQSGIHESEGFEIDFNGDITPNLSIVASYGYTDTKDKDSDGNNLKNIPNHTANLFSTYYLSSFNLSNIYIGGGARYIGSRYANDMNTIKFDSEIIYNATLGYKKGNWKANMSIQNLTNEKYVEGAISNGTSNGTEWARVYAGTPRIILASIGYTF